MSGKNGKSNPAASPRQPAERIARGEPTPLPPDLEAQASEAVRWALHELRMQKIALELQNEELREAQAALTAVQAHYFDLYDVAPMGYLILNEAGLILEANLTAAKMLGAIRAALVTQPISRFILKEDQAGYDQHAGQLRVSREPQDFDLRMVKVDGTTFWANLAATATTSKDGAPVCRLVLRDSTRCKRTEEALRDSAARLQAITDSTQDAILMMDQNGDISFWNPAAERMLGYTSAEALGQNLHLLIAPAEYRAAQQAAFPRFQQTGQGGAIGKTLDVEARRKDGQRITVQLSLSAIQMHGNWQGVGVLRDITERKTAEAALRASEEHFRALFELAPVGLAEADPRSGQWLRVNQKLCAITGYTALELLRVRTSEITHPDDRQEDWEGFQKLVRGEAPDQRGEKRLVRKDGMVVWVKVHSTLHSNAAGQVIRAMATIEDVTEQKRLEAEREAMEMRLRQQQRLESVGTLAGGLAHEINNPINGIMNYAQLIQDRLKRNSPLSEFAAEILVETERVANVVRNLLTFARSERAGRSPDRMLDIVEGTLSLSRAILRHDQITLKLDVPAELPQFKCSRQDLQQVLMHLITNAREALNARYPGYDPAKVLDVSARQFENAGDPWIRLTVEDHGTGILPEVQERMFDPFFTTKSRDRGAGLGLTISHGIVKDHHGKLTVETKLGGGTRVHMDLPVES